MGGLAGCVGGDGSDGDGGTDGGGGDGSDGSDGDGGGGVQDGEQLEPRMTSALPPSGFYLPVLDYFEREGLPDEVFREYGFEGIDVRATWDDATLFASDNAQFSHGNAVEGAATAKNQGWNMTYFGWGLAALGGVMVESGGPYDPGVTGGVQESLDKASEEGAVFGHWGWNSGTLLNNNVVMRRGYDHEVAEDGGSFDQVQVLNAPGAVAPLILRGDLDLGLTDPIHAGEALSEMLDGELTPLWFSMNKFVEFDIGFPAVNDLGLKTETYEQYPEAAEAYIDLWDRGFDWMYRMAESGELPGIAHPLEGFPATNEEEAQFLIDVYMMADQWFEYSAIPRDASYTEGIIAGEQQYLENGVELGFVPEDWEEICDWVILEGQDNPGVPKPYPT